MKKHYFTPLLGTAVLGLSIYMGYRTYNAYTAIGKNKLFLENIEALATEEEDKPTCGTRTEFCIEKLPAIDVRFVKDGQHSMF